MTRTNDTAQRVANDAEGVVDSVVEGVVDGVTESVRCASDAVTASDAARQLRRLPLAVLASMALLATGGCTGMGLGGLGVKSSASTASSAYVDDTEPADRLYNEALANADAGNTAEALKKFKKVDRQHPFSVHGRKAMVMTTYLSYKQKKYDDAIATGRRFVRMHPADEDAAYVQYLIGQSYHKQIMDVTRDQRAAKKSIEAFTQVVERYPDSEYVPDARRKVRMGRDQLAGKDMQVGRYYQERREHLAGINRFRRVVETYENTRHVEEALFRLTESYYALGLVSEAQTAAAVLGHNFPDSRWYKDAYALLGRGGYKPEENRGSWISRAAQTIIGRG